MRFLQDVHGAGLRPEFSHRNFSRVREKVGRDSASIDFKFVVMRMLRGGGGGSDGNGSPSY